MKVKKQIKILTAGFSTTTWVIGKIILAAIGAGYCIYIMITSIEEYQTLIKESQILIETTIHGLPEQVNGIAQTATEILTNPIYQKMKPQEQYDYLKKMEEIIIEKLSSKLEQPAETIKKLNSLRNLYSGLAKDKLIEIENLKEK